ncbi:LPXTG cell wall anchor domain-containing protein [Candidatus Enterococcus mansonii]|uniref:Gram-positive cocci surface proteins LPxTG domain-containing protein n=1 Tax=Candidatus Enterococcus mansonii TaxID=1834181 RepID=A0A242CC57_9ENTE|nr:LPXTG cell wall anchor domain-containing protein [Enterococcus sp. 4G2_DIV0659]OTO07776.1 hypothetical protein A5880_002046 [Enterococcus sp. 4G2_DIV0659]
MKQRYLFSALFISIVFTTLLFGHPMVGEAEENGGAVQTNGGITFYEESTSNSAKESNDSNATTTPSQMQMPKPTKPVGRYPSTGELVKASLGISGIILIGIGLILFYLKRKKEQRNIEGKEG